MNEFIHPEKGDTEVFFTNCAEERFKLMNWVTKRMGKVAYDGNGVKIDIPDWFPVFIQKKELDEAGLDLPSIRSEFRMIDTRS